MKEITLTNGTKTQVDDIDFEYLNQFTWRIHTSSRNGKMQYVCRSITKDGKSHIVMMHRLILGLTDSKTYGDHIDHNGLNNQRSNLRIATIAQNNAYKRSSGTSKYLGVHYDKRRNLWVACITINKKCYKLGRFSNEEDAAKAYDNRAIEVHKQFANLNFP